MCLHFFFNECIQGLVVWIPTGIKDSCSQMYIDFHFENCPQKLRFIFHFIRYYFMFEDTSNILLFFTLANFIVKQLVMRKNYSIMGLHYLIWNDNHIWIRVQAYCVSKLLSKNSTFYFYCSWVRAFKYLHCGYHFHRILLKILYHSPH